MNAARKTLAVLGMFAIAGGYLTLDLHLLSSRLIRRKLLVDVLTELTERKISLGDMHFGPFSGLELKGLSVASKDPSAKFPLVEASQISVSHSWLDLVQGSYQPTRVDLVHPSISLLADVQGRWELGQLLAAVGAERARPGKQAPLPHVFVQQGTARISHPLLFNPNYTQKIEQIMLWLRPFSSFDYYVDGTFDAGMLGTWNLKGLVNVERESLDLELRAQDLDIRSDPSKGVRFEALFAETIRAVFGNYQPAGKVDVEAKIRRPGRDEPLDFEVVLTLKEAALTFVHFPYPVEKIAGTVTFRPQGATLANLEASSGDMRVRLNGSTRGYDRDAAVDVQLDFKGLPLDDRLRKAILDPRVYDFWGKLSARGKSRGTARVTRAAGPEEPTRAQIVAHLEDCAATPEFLPYHLEQIQGEIEIGDDTLHLKKLTARHGESRLEIRGTIGSWQSDAAFDLEVKAEPLVLDEDLRQALPQDLQEVWDRYKPKGPVGLAWQIQKPQGAQTEISHSVTLRLSETEFSPTELASSWKCTAGEISYDGTKVVLQNIRARKNSSSLSIGVNSEPSIISLGPDLEPKEVRLHLQATQLSFENDILPALSRPAGPALSRPAEPAAPSGLRQTLEDLQARGTADVEVQLTKTRRDNGEMFSDTIARIRLHDASLRPGLKLSGIQGEIQLQRSLLGEKELMSHGSISLERLRFQDARLEKLSSNFHAKEGKLVLEELTANLYSGRLDGRVVLDSENRTYRGELRLTGIQLTEYAREAALTEKEVSGQIDGQIELEGKAGDLSSLSGGGTFRLKDGQLWEVPLFFQLLLLFNLNLAKPGAFREGDIDFRIGGEKIHVRKLDLRGESANITGKGHVGFDGRLHMLLDPKFTRGGLPSVPILDELLGRIKQELLAVEATGTFRNPVLALKPLPTLLKYFEGTENR